MEKETHFDDIGQAEAQIASLDKAKYETLHRGKTITNKSQLNNEKERTTQPEEEALQENLAVVNKRTNKLSSIVSKRYDLLQHEDAFQPVIDAVRNLDLNAYGTIEQYNEGDVVVMKVLFKDFNFSIESDYFLGFYAINSYDKTAGFQVHPYGERQICSNGMMAKRTLDIKSVHRKHMGEVAAEKKITKWLQRLADTRTEFKNLLEEAREENFHDVELVLENAGFPTSKVEEIMSRLSRDPEVVAPTRFDLYNAATNYVTHEVDGAVSTNQKYMKNCENLLNYSKEYLTAIDKSEVDA